MDDVVERDAFWMELFMDDVKDSWKDVVLEVLLKVGALLMEEEVEDDPYGFGDVVTLPL